MDAEPRWVEGEVRDHKCQDKLLFPCRSLDARLRGHDHRGVIPAQAGIQVMNGSTSEADAERSIRLFADHVMPAFP